MQRHSCTESTLDTFAEGLGNLRRSLSSIRRKKKTLSAICTGDPRAGGIRSGPNSPTSFNYSPTQIAYSPTHLAYAVTQCGHRPLRAVRSAGGPVFDL